jgi:hypothetical protein
MDIEKQKKNVRQATISSVVFLLISLIFFPWTNGEGGGVGAGWGGTIGGIMILFSIPLTIFYGVLAFIRISRLRKMKRQG